MRYLATESGLVLAERELPRIAAPELWIPQEGSIWDLPPLNAFGVSGAIGTSLMGAGGAVTPLTILGSGCKQWCRAETGCVLDTTPRGTGSTIQAVTFTGQPPAPVELYIQITATGALGAGTYKYGAHGSGGPFIESGLTLGATHTCLAGSEADGVTLNFPAGTYTNGDVYQALYSSWLDQSGFGNDFHTASSTTAALYQHPATMGGAPSLGFNGATAYMTCSSLVLANGNDPAFSLIFEAYVATVGVTKVMIGCGSSSTLTPLWDLSVDASIPQWGFSKRDDSTTTKTCSGGTPDITKHYFTLVNDGATQFMWVDQTQVSLSSSGDLNVGQTTLDRMTIGARLSTTVTQPLAVGFSEIVGVDRALTTQERQALWAYFGNKYP